MWSPKDKDGDTILVATHVDDSIVTGSDNNKTNIFVRELLDLCVSSWINFDGTFQRYLTEMLGMEWERDIEAGTTVLHQRAFSEELLKAFGFWEYMTRRYWSSPLALWDDAGNTRRHGKKNKNYLLLTGTILLYPKP